MLPTVQFCGLTLTRLSIGANPFGGFSHQNPERDAAMKSWNTPQRIRETWARAHAAGINVMVTNNETPHVVETVEGYLRDGGPLQWIAQVSNSLSRDMKLSVDRVAQIGCRALYFHGGLVDQLYAKRDDGTLRQWVSFARTHKIPVGVAGHAPEVHDWVDSLGLVDFHVVCFFNCGSLHSGQGHKFRLADVAPAVQCIRRLKKPCIGYKIMGAGRIDPAMAFEYAFDNLKAGDIVNVGMHRGDKDGIVEENVGIVRSLLAR
jgi:hypothetical protein